MNSICSVYYLLIIFKIIIIYNIILVVFTTSKLLYDYLYKYVNQSPYYRLFKNHYFINLLNIDC